MLQGEIARTDPFYVDIDVTNRCNLKCVGCQYHSPYIHNYSPRDPAVSDIAFEMLEKLCNEWHADRTSTLVLQGSGEPLLHPDILKMVDMIKKKGFRVVLVTNGVLLNRETIGQLIQSGLDSITISLWASSRKQYKEMYIGADPDFFHRIIASLKLISEMKTASSCKCPEVVLYHAINKYNHEALEEMIALASECGCDRIVFSPMVNIKGEIDAFVLTDEEEAIVRERIATLKKQCRQHAIGVNIDWTLLRYSLKDELWTYFPCSIAWFHARIRVDGSVQPCGRCDTEVIFGNVRKKPFREIWNDRNIRKFRNSMLHQRDLNYWRAHCFCNRCCFIWDMKRVHQVYKWFRPLADGLRNWKK